MPVSISREAMQGWSPELLLLLSNLTTVAGGEMESQINKRQRPGDLGHKLSGTTNSNIQQ